MSIFSRLVSIFNPRLGTFLDPPKKSSTDPSPLRIGILGAANIAPQAVIGPASYHSGVVVQAVAARDENRAREYARQHGIPTVFKSYQELLDSPDIDAVYNPLPNYHHFEWTMKALKAGKHVLLEKPSSNNSEEMRQMVELAKEKNLVLLEAFHYRFHPANQRFREIVTGGSLGKLKKIEIQFTLPYRMFPKNDIRFNYDLGGGATTDLGCYAVSYCRWLNESEPTVAFAKAETLPGNPKVDRAMKVNLIFDSPGQPQVLAEINYDLARPWRFGLIPYIPQTGIKAICENGVAIIDNFPGPHLFHTITIAENGKPKATEKCYKFTEPNAVGEEWWPTYRYQLEAFVNQVRGRTPQLWITGEDSVAQMKVLEAIYEKSGLEPRPTSAYMS
ncbi:hypothetical protein M408DRAFT_333358 [Serendipita vermifera MAFF 305830]|uniref:D-xylose 1-dehydrogenase (NADP(+), D-xylono-1,5-lactone-forming) n=1 Tax=Serendipita vermifera MAFF 305830 TaxID=933852 RepID=A0A0C2WW84_SERVB|nr:hypothetical protein M408DRAFT_333358 [Serendipita vermifera MAFF 305830]